MFGRIAFSFRPLSKSKNVDQISFLKPQQKQKWFCWRWYSRKFNVCRIAFRPLSKSKNVDQISFLKPQQKPKWFRWRWYSRRTNVWPNCFQTTFKELSRLLSISRLVGRALTNIGTSASLLDFPAKNSHQPCCHQLMFLILSSLVLAPYPVLSWASSCSSSTRLSSSPTRTSSPTSTGRPSWPSKSWYSQG